MKNFDGFFWFAILQETVAQIAQHFISENKILMNFFELITLVIKKQHT